MPRAARDQFNVRSAFARARAHELAKLTGMTATQVVEEALRAYAPAKAAAPVGRLVRRGPVLVLTSKGEKISLDQANAALNAVRERDLDD